MATTGPFYDTMPGPLRRDTLNQMWGVWQAAIGSPIKGDAGWSPLMRSVQDGDRVVLEVYDWAGGQGAKPAQTGFLGSTGFVATAALAIDVRGPQGLKGNAATISVGTVTTTAPGTNATVLNTGTSSNAVFAFGIPRGATGLKGDAATVSVGTVTTGAAGTSASVTNSGTQNAATLNFTIPRGANGGQGIQGVKGDQGAKGDKGDSGAAATITVGTVTTGSPGTSVVVTNSGTSGAAVFNFTIPRGADGSGSGDMLKASYDSVGDGVVNASRSTPWAGITGKPVVIAAGADAASARSVIDAASTAALTTGLGNKVDKVTGKGLSTEDFTSAEKAKLSGLGTASTANVTTSTTDTVAGRLLKIGDDIGFQSLRSFGNYYPDTVGRDINDVPVGDKGLYATSNPGTWPIGGGGFLYVETQSTYSGGSSFQTAYTYTTTGTPMSRKWIRFKANSTGSSWGDWQEFWHSGNFDPNSKANLASPALTGTPTAPTAASTTNTTQLATTAFVQAVNAADTGSAATAVKLKTARTINGVSFDGTANITVADSTKLPLAGGTVTGTLSVQTPGTADTIASLSSSSGKALEVKSAGSSATAGSATILFHRPSAYAAYLGLDTDNQLKFGGYSAGAVAYKIWHEGSDGVGSGLDADLLDGQHGSFYQNASNLTTGTVPEARIPALPISKVTNLQTTLDSKVDKVTGKQLSTEDYTSAEKTKLSGIAAGANAYTHPANHPASIITQDANNRFVTDAEKAAWNAKGAGDVTLAGVQTLTNKTVEAGVFTNGYTEETVAANTATAYTINLSNGSVQVLTLTGNCTYTFPAPVAGKSFTLIQKQDASGSRTVTWPASVKWPGDIVPTITSAANKVDKFIFTAIDGSSWLGSVAGLNYTA